MTMPQLLPLGGQVSEDALQEMELELPNKRPRRASMRRNIGGWFKKHEQKPHTAPIQPSQWERPFVGRRCSLQNQRADRLSERVVSPPLRQSIKSQDAERDDNLLQRDFDSTERRARCDDPRRCCSTSPIPRRKSPQPVPLPSISAPAIGDLDQHASSQSFGQQHFGREIRRPARNPPIDLPPLQIPDNINDPPGLDEADDDHGLDRIELEDEYDQKWILNLSMHFRDNSNREKFFVTYAETPSRWRRLTVSLDYSNAPDDSLEADLSTLHYQRDKSFRIYEAIRESLPDIQYYDTVTNLKLETTPDDGQLHVHVREDANEIVQYPETSMFDHVQVPFFMENELDFLSHLSGFVYKVQVGGRTLIKKEIQGPDTVDEFLYEVNALDSLLECSSVVQLEGLVTDDTGAVVKGLLISYASQGTLVDMIYDLQGTAELPWYRREKWAKQIVQGLSDIHEAGFVQGDFTMSNIVIDEDDDAQVIDINRRGCPVGWEPPELGRLIDSGQRIGMCIGVKTDLFQLGMVLWALAEENDEPERVERPLPRLREGVPSYFREIVDACLSPRPQDRATTKRLLRIFPMSAGRAPSTRGLSVDFREECLRVSDNSISASHRSDKEYIDPQLAVTIDEVRRRRNNSGTTDYTSGQVTYLDPEPKAASTSLHFESSGSWIVGHRRGRSPVSSRRRRSSPYARSVSSATSLSSAESAARRLQRGFVYDDDDDGDDDDDDDVECFTKAEEGAVAARFPNQSCAEKEHPQTVERSPIPANTKPELKANMLPSLSDPRLAAVQQHDYAQLLHTDSGFDEQMIEELQLADHNRYSGAGRNKDDDELQHVKGVDVELPKAAEEFRTPDEIASAASYENHEIRQR